MTDPIKELHAAGFALLLFLKASTDRSVSRSLDDLVTNVALSQGDRLRKEAERADRKDAVISRFREALVNFAASQSNAGHE